MARAALLARQPRVHERGRVLGDPRQRVDAPAQDDDDRRRAGGDDRLDELLLHAREAEVGRRRGTRRSCSRA